MDDVIYTGQITDLNPLVSKITWESGALMILECFQNRWLDKEERENVIRFERFDSGQDFNFFQTGRIFDPEKELFWSWLDKKIFHAIYSGKKADLPELHTDEGKWERLENKYMLWGRKYKKKPVFLELQIPRLLRYPFSCREDKRQRLALKVIEYQDKLTCQTQHCRFLGLEEVL